MKIVAIIVVILLLILGVLAALHFSGVFTLFPIETPENNSSISQVTDEQTTSTSSDISETTSSSTDSTSTEPTGSNSSTAGGNSDIATYIEVTVSEDKYFYDNHEISYDDLIKVLDELDENTAVKITDENAALNAYESLTKALEEREILFEAG